MSIFNRQAFTIHYNFLLEITKNNEKCVVFKSVVLYLL